jgi:hypothetical protein
VKELVNNIYDFLAAHDFPTLVEAMSKIEWSQVARSPYTWFIILPLLTYLIWTKKYKTITALASLFLFLLLVQRTLQSAGETLSLDNLLIFVSGTVALIGLNLYLVFVRE